MMGMLMLGKISPGMRSATRVRSRNMRNAATTNLYGRLSAIRTMPSMVSESIRRGVREHCGTVSIEMRRGSIDIEARPASRNMSALGEAMRDIVIYEEDFQTCALLKEWLGEAGYNVRVGNRREP